MLSPFDLLKFSSPLPCSLSHRADEQFDQTLIPSILATIEEGGYTNILPPVALDVCSDPSTWPRPGAQAEGGGAALWDAMMCINMIHISPQVFNLYCCCLYVR